MSGTRARLTPRDTFDLHSHGPPPCSNTCRVAPHGQGRDFTGLCGHRLLDRATQFNGETTAIPTGCIWRGSQWVGRCTTGRIEMGQQVRCDGGDRGRNHATAKSSAGKASRREAQHRAAVLACRPWQWKSDTGTRTSLRCGRDTRSAANRVAPVLHASESDPRRARIRRVRQRLVPAILPGRELARPVAWALFATAADRIFRRLGGRTRDSPIRDRHAASSGAYGQITAGAYINLGQRYGTFVALTIMHARSTLPLRPFVLGPFPAQPPGTRAARFCGATRRK